MLEEVNKYSISHYDASTGLETWFNLPDVTVISSRLPKWKMAIVVFPKLRMANIACAT